MKLLIPFICLLLPVTLMAAKTSEEASKKEDLNGYFSKLNKKVESRETVESEELLPEEMAELKEADIPLALKEKKSKSKAMVTPFNKMIISLAVLLFFSFSILIWIQRRGKKGVAASGARNIKILSQKAIGPKKELMIIRIAGETILLGVTEHNINPIKSLSLLDDEMPEFTTDEFSKELTDKITTDFYEEPQAEPVNGYAVSRLSEVKDIVSQRYS